MKTITHIAITTLLFYGGTLMAQEYPYKDSRLPVEERVQDLLSRMTMEEKIGQLSMKSLKALELDNNNRVTDSSLVNLFAGESIGCLESPFVEHDKVAIYSEAADHYFRTNPFGNSGHTNSRVLTRADGFGYYYFPSGDRIGLYMEPGID